jgi:hypothetical protein
VARPVRQRARGRLVAVTAQEAVLLGEHAPLFRELGLAARDRRLARLQRRVGGVGRGAAAGRASAAFARGAAGARERPRAPARSPVRRGRLRGGLLPRQHAGGLELDHHLFRQVAIDLQPFGAVAEEQDGVGDHVDDARHAAAAPVHQVGHLGRELERRPGGRPAQPVVDVRGGLVGVEGAEVIAHGDALAQLLELRPRERVAQVGLADEHHLQQLRLLGLEVREHAEFLEGPEAEVLRLVDDEQHEPAVLPFADEELGELAQHRRLAGLGLEAEVEQDGLDELARVEHRVHDARERRLAVESAQQRLQQRGLAGADLAGDDDEARVSLDAVAQVAQRLPVHAARVQVVGVGLSENGRSRSW